MISNLLNYIGSWIFDIIKVAIVCVLAYPIAMIGYALHKGIRMNSLLNKTIKELKTKGESINWNKVNQVRADANKQLIVGYIGIAIMAISYVLILVFVPDFFKFSLLALIPFGLGLFGLFLIPSVD